MHVTPNMYNIMTLKANAKEIVTVKHAFDTKYVQNCYFEGKCLENHYCKIPMSHQICTKS